MRICHTYVCVVAIVELILHGVMFGPHCSSWCERRAAHSSFKYTQACQSKPINLTVTGPGAEGCGTRRVFGVGIVIFSGAHWSG